MARIRTIKPEFFSSEDITNLSPLSRLFYVSLWCEADRSGRFEYRPGTLKNRYFPADEVKVDSLMDELISGGLVKLYQPEGYPVLGFIPTFEEHQVINNREQKSSLPPFSHDAWCTRESGVKAEGKEGRKERKGREGKEVPEIDDDLFAEQQGPHEATSADFTPEPEVFDAESPEAILATLLLTEHRKSDPAFQVGKDLANVKRWAPDIEKLMRIDKRSFDDVKRVILWCQAPGGFWAANILSGSKLREKFPSLILQAQGQTNGRHAPEVRATVINTGGSTFEEVAL